MPRVFVVLSLALFAAACRHPIEPLHPAIRARMIDLLKPLDPLVLRWGK